MARSTQVVTLVTHTCDNCKRTTELAEGIEPDGYQGDVTYYEADGVAPEADWFACRTSCIKGAVQAAVAREPMVQA